MIENFGTNRGIEEIRAHPADIVIPAGGRLTIDLGGKQVEIIDFWNSPRRAATCLSGSRLRK